MDIDVVLSKLGEVSASPLAVRVLPLGETVVDLLPEHVRPAVECLGQQLNVWHLSTITGDDVGDDIVLMYHFWDQVGLTLRVPLEREHPMVPTIIDLIPGAAFYEREVTEMLDVMFEWHPMSKHLFLPDDWRGEAPLRKGADHG